MQASRTVLEGHYATVRFIGQLQGQEGDWVGLEWDEAARGKHDGSTGGIRYFDGAPGACSFVRKSKFEQLAPQPVSIAAALVTR